MNLRFFLLCTFLCTHIGISQSVPLIVKFQQSIRAIIDSSDAVIGVSIKDLRTSETFSFNETEIFPTASSIKIFILAEVFKQAAEGKFSLQEVRQLPKQFRVGGSGILSMLSEKSSSLTIRDYCVLMMNLSDNSATNFLLDLCGMKNINESIQKYGCANTKLQRVMMDVQAAKEGRENIGTPKDCTLILEKLFRGEIVSKQASEEIVSIMKLEKEGWLKSGIPIEISIANKAGDLDGVRCDVGIIFLENNPYIISVMTKYLQNANNGSQIISKISEKTFQYFERKASFNQFGRKISK